ncbi:hemerythrin family protein [Persephonella atlantica]|uniref:Hemerythrin family protein n=1 Tax=Persephonella atlantica TaxID=2699429 RepID=A0ABS1GFG3_9AQUI|nr:hemerythrin family protein [Persephonella atlantica]MBK3331669.1 hemerythrin family protein [Persephonella atlantica]
MLLDISEIPKVALERMNKVHEEEIKILNQLYEAIEEFQKGKGSLEEIDKKFEEFFQDVLKHFSSEQEMMEQYNFFAYPMHRGEHDMVLGQLHSLKKRWEKEKNPEMIKSYIEKEFLPWLMNHIQTMDTVTAHFLSHFIRD